MKRSAAERAVGESTLTRTERLVMFSLLRRSNNDDCSLPAWARPTEKQLAREVVANERDLRRLLRHLEAHGWLEVPDGQYGRGRPPLDKQQPTKSRRSGYVLVPRTPERCAPPCSGVRKRDRKRGGQPPAMEAETGGQAPSGKGGTECPSSEVSDGAASRDCAVTRGVGEGTAFVPVWALPRPAPDDSWKVWPAGSIGAEVNGGRMRECP